MFNDRLDAGQQLAALLEAHDIEADVVLGIPRGGLPVARVVADSLGVPLDVVVARKLGAPWNPELAIGAVASDGTVWVNEPLVSDAGVGEEYIRERVESEGTLAREKLARYREGRTPVDLRGKRVLIVDDGLATGATTMACLRQVRNAGAERVVVAVPVAPPETVERLREEADDVVCVETPPHFGAVGQFYEAFDQVSDEEAATYLESEAERAGGR